MNVVLLSLHSCDGGVSLAPLSREREREILFCLGRLSLVVLRWFYVLPWVREMCCELRTSTYYR